MTRAFIAAALVALVIVAAVVVTVAVTPRAFGSGDAAQSAPTTNSRVIAVKVDVARKAHKPRKTPAPAHVRVVSAPAAPAPVTAPVAPRILAQTPTPAPTAVSGRRQRSTERKHPSAPTAIEARTQPPATAPQRTGNLDGTD